MIEFENFLTFVLCGPHRDQWARHFVRLVGSATLTQATGAWQGPRVSETEPVVIFTVALPEDCADVVARVVESLKRYQRFERQEAVYVEAVSRECRKALVVFEADWRAASDRLQSILDRGLWLADYFTASAETGAGCDVSDHHWQH